MNTEFTYEGKCFVCNNNVKSSIDDKKDLTINEPVSHATLWTTKGNWGSALLDGDGINLQMIICDRCLLERKNRVIQYYKYIPPYEYTVKNWNPDEDHQAG